VLLTTQITDRNDSNFGGFICPSTNPDFHPIHSRSAEAMYPFAVAYKITHKEKYRAAAVRAGNWLTRIQETTGRRKGGWSENWPDPAQKGWFGTTTDQLISMIGAYAIVKSSLTTHESEKWNHCMSDAADFIAANFPMGSNINYNPTGAATLLYAYQTINSPNAEWLGRAEILIDSFTLPMITPNNFLSGEGGGVDEGYNLAQSIGYLALYGILKKDSGIIGKAAQLLSAHAAFVYPNGSVDNSWGTRSFKWNYESGTKTAPGVYFSFALLASRDPSFEAIGLQCLDYLNRFALVDNWIVYGPHATKHAESSPPCNYSTFARAQSLALAIEFGKPPSASIKHRAAARSSIHFYPEMKVAVFRSPKMMATVSGNGQISNYSRESVCRGGSISNLWMEGFGRTGFVQASSSASYKRIEALHMPLESNLEPLTPRIEFTRDSVCFSNIFEDSLAMTVSTLAQDHLIAGATTIRDSISRVVAKGILKNIKGVKSGILYTLTHDFYEDSIVKTYEVSGGVQAFSIIEPIIKDRVSVFQKTGNVVQITTSNGSLWKLDAMSSDVPVTISLGKDAQKYWAPFPGVEAFPIVISFVTPDAQAHQVKVTLHKMR
jgi:hypothetical protein